MKYKVELVLCLFSFLSSSYANTTYERKVDILFHEILSSEEQVEQRNVAVVERLSSLKVCMKKNLFMECSEEHFIKTSLNSHYTVCAYLLPGREWHLPIRKLPFTESFSQCLGIFRQISTKEGDADLEKIVTYRNKKIRARDAISDLILRHELDEIILEVKSGHFYKSFYDGMFPAPKDYWEGKSGQKIKGPVTGVLASIHEYKTGLPASSGRKEMYPLPEIFFFYHFKDLQNGGYPRPIRRKDLKKIKILIRIKSDRLLEKFFSL